MDRDQHSQNMTNLEKEEGKAIQLQGIRMRQSPEENNWLISLMEILGRSWQISATVDSNARRELAEMVTEKQEGASAVMERSQLESNQTK